MKTLNTILRRQNIKILKSSSCVVVQRGEKIVFDTQLERGNGKFKNNGLPLVVRKVLDSFDHRDE